MALTLRTAITANDTTFDVLGSDDLEAGDFKTIDSETVVIRSVRSATLGYGESPRYRVSVYRGTGGSRAAAHAANATLATFSGGVVGGGVTVTDGTTTVDPATSLSLPAGTLSSPGGGEADMSGLAGLQTIQLLGPFRVEFDDAGLTIAVKLVDLPEGTRLIWANCRVVDTWDEDADAAQLAIFTSTDPYDGAQAKEMFRYLVGDNWFPTNSTVSEINAPEVVGTDGPSAGTVVFSSSRGCVMTADGAAYVTAYGVADATQGAVDIELLIATPA